MNQEMVETTVFLQVEPVYSGWRKDSNGDHEVEQIRVTKHTKARPSSVKGVAVKLKIRIPVSAFKRLSPEVTITIPESALDFEPEVTVEMPDQEQEEATDDH